MRINTVKVSSYVININSWDDDKKRVSTSDYLEIVKLSVKGMITMINQKRMRIAKKTAFI